MPKIYDNIENHLTKGLNEALELSQRTDFCVGYFNLRSWKEVADKIDSLSGATVVEGKDDVHRICRLHVGMQKMPIDILRDYFSKDDDHIIDKAEAVKFKKRLASDNELFGNNLQTGLLINFGSKSLQFKRLFNKKYKFV